MGMRGFPPSPLAPGISWKRRILTALIAFIPAVFLSYIMAPLHEFGHLLGAWASGYNAEAITFNTVVLFDRVRTERSLFPITIGGPLLTILLLWFISWLIRYERWAPWFHFFALVTVILNVFNAGDYKHVEGNERTLYFLITGGFGVLSLVSMTKGWRRLHVS